MSLLTKKETNKDIFLNHFGIGITEKIDQRMADESAKKIELLLEKNKDKESELLKTLSLALDLELSKNEEFVKLLRKILVNKYPKLESKTE